MNRYMKCLIALLGGLSSWGVTASIDGYDDAELWGILAIVATALAVFAVPNTPPAGEARQPDVSEAERGQSTLGIAVAALIIAIVCLILIL